MREALFYEQLEDRKARCRLCPHNCLIYPGRVGLCCVRYNDNGRLAPLSYGRVSSVQLDPIEKKPLNFFHPGSMILSVGSVGCNLGCPFCQNWQIAHPKDALRKETGQARPAMVETVERMTETLGVTELVALANRYRSQGNIGVAFTYNEPFIWFEYLLEATAAVRVAGMKNVLVTNGFVNEAPLAELLPNIDAMNIDIKGFSQEVYAQLGGELDPVLKTARSAAASCHVEITNLLVPGLNTAPEQIEALVDWIADTLGPDTPLHFSRYFPARRAQEPATTPAVMIMAKELALKRLNSVLLGNI